MIIRKEGREKGSKGENEGGRAKKRGKKGGFQW